MVIVAKRIAVGELVKEMNKPNIITISGKAESGKDLTATLLKEELEKIGKRVLIMHYADYVKYVSAKFFGWDGQKDEKGRSILQYIGTEKARSVNPNYWVDTIIEFIKVFGDDFDYILIPDCRFPNEVFRLEAKSLEVTSIHIERLGHENCLTPEQRLHASETAMDSFMFDYSIQAKTGVENLRKEVVKFIDWEMEI